MASHLAAVAALALTLAPATPEVEEERTPSAGVPVRFRGEEIFLVRSQVGRLAPAARAAAIEERLLRLRSGLAAEVRVEEHASSSDLYAGEAFVLSVTGLDAAPTGRTRQQLAADAALRLRLALEREDKSRSVRGLLVAGLLALLATFGLTVLLRQMGRAFPRLHRALRAWRGTRIPGIHLLGSELLSAERTTDLLVSTTRLLRVAITLVAIAVYASVVLGLFPWTRGLAAAVTRAAWQASAAALQALVSFLPDLASLLLIAVLARAFIRLARLLGQQVQDGRLTIPGLHQEWANPTFQIVRFLVVALALVLAFPFLPGSGSPAFRGVSVFLGVLLSLGSASAVANLVAGVMLVYMRPFAVGDRVRIADRLGDVVERNLLLVRLRTPRNEEVTLSSSSVLGAPIVNLSAAARAGGLVLHSTVTIGHDVPWRRVHALLLEAASAVEGVLPEPPPLVLQTSLGERHVSYEVSAHTDRARDLPLLTSRLLESIQDTFRAAGVELASPPHAAARGGSAEEPAGSDAD